MMYFLLLVIVAAVIWFFVQSSQRTKWLPSELKNAQLVMNESPISVLTSKGELVGRPDRVYRLPNGLHVPLEFKTRTVARVYQTDVAELSLQAWVLRRSGYATCNFAFVLAKLRHMGGYHTLRVKLMDDVACEALFARYLEISHRRAAPIKNAGVQCKSCGHRTRCEKR